MDFIGPLPETKDKNNAILVIVDTLTKAVSLIPIKTTDGAPEIARIFYRQIFSRFGVPQKIISDRDPRITGAFWRRLLELINTKLALSTAFHPQTDGQTERANRFLEQVLRNTINYWQTNWDDLLPAAEFAINSSVNESTGFAPFELMYGLIPAMPIDLINQDSKIPAAEELIKKIISAVKTARTHIIKAQISQKHHADKHRRQHKFKIGDLVLLNNQNLRVPDHKSRKLSPKFAGPFKIIA